MTDTHVAPANPFAFGAAAPAAEPVKDVRRTSLVAGDINPQGNVIVWDHGPHDKMPDPVPALAPDSDAYKAMAAQYEANRLEWHRVNGQGPVALTMDAGNAAHSIAVDPERYTLEPLSLDDAEVNAEVEAIQKRREEAKKVSEDRAAAIQLAADRKAAIATVMANRAAKAVAEKAAPALTPTGRKVETGAQTAARLAVDRADADQAEARRVRNDPASTPEEIEAARLKADQSRRFADEAQRKAKPNA